MNTADERSKHPPTAGKPPRPRTGLVRPEWRLSDKAKRAKYYQLTPAGKRHLTAERSRWESFVLAMGRVLQPSEE